MPSPRVIWNGNPGEVWQNTSDKAKYQFICNFSNSCGTCIQYHLAISNWWPIPIHRRCRCRQLLILPSGSAQPFENFRDILDDLPAKQKTEAIGASNYKLLQSGLVKWDDIVTPTRVRDLQEVVARRKLTVDQMTSVGVQERYAQQAFDRVHTPVAEAIRARRRELIKNIENAGISREQLRGAIVSSISERIGIAAGPSKVQALPKSINGGMAPKQIPEDLKSSLDRFQSWTKETEVKKTPLLTREEPKPISASTKIADRIKQSSANNKLESILEVKSLSREAFKELDNITDEITAFKSEAKSRKDYGQIAVDLDKLDKKYDAVNKRYDALLSEEKSKTNNVLKNKNTQIFVNENGKGARGTWSKGSKLETARKEAVEWIKDKLASTEESYITIRWDSVVGVRASANPDKTITVSSDCSTVTMIHEIGHQLEYQSVSIRKAVREFLDHRIGNETPSKLKDLFPDSGYRDDEFGRGDEFGKAFGNQKWYVGKHYNDGITTEVIPMGLQKLYTDPTGFAEKDPEFCTFIMGILDGSLRKY